MEDDKMLIGIRGSFKGQKHRKDYLGQSYCFIKGESPRNVPRELGKQLLEVVIGEQLVFEACDEVPVADAPEPKEVTPAPLKPKPYKMPESPEPKAAKPPRSVDQVVQDIEAKKGENALPIYTSPPAPEPEPEVEVEVEEEEPEPEEEFEPEEKPKAKAKRSYRKGAKRRKK